MQINTDPWSNMAAGSERLIKNKNDFKIYWGVERNGDFALYFRVETNKKKLFNSINIEKIEIGMFEDNIPGNYIWVIVLKDKVFKDMFKTLCFDLCIVANLASDEKMMLGLIQSRLFKWQKLLEKKSDSFTIIKQMGLYSELNTLLKLISPEKGMEKSINSWIGSEFDKQDFTFEKTVIEVKSHKSSKGFKVMISSKEQLYTPKENLYLISYALTVNDSGKTVEDLIQEIEFYLKEDYKTSIEFKKKIMNYGYFYDSKNNKDFELVKFKIDSINFYEVKEDFPRIIPKDLLPGVVAINYTIDLSTCSNFEISQSSMKI